MINTEQNVTTFDKIGYFTNEDAEKALISYILNDTSKINLIRNQISPNYFSNDIYSTIYQKMIEISSSNKPFDYIDVSMSVSDRFTNSKYNISEIFQQMIYSISDMDFNTARNKLIDSYIRREILRLSDNLQRQIGVEKDINPIIHDFINKTTNMLSGVESLQDNLSDFKSANLILSEISSGKNTQVQIKSGFEGLDRLLKGFLYGHINVIAARPSIGKTSIACNLMSYFVNSGKRVIFFSLETSARYVLYKLASSNFDINYQCFIDNKGSISEIEKMKEAALWLQTMVDQNLLRVVDNCSRAHDIMIRIREMYIEMKIDVIMIDFLQIVHHVHSHNQQTFFQINEFLAQLKQLANELNISVFILSQLSRAVENTNDKIPQLNHLAHSSAIETAADTVIFLHREDYYEKDKTKIDLTRSKTSVIVSKNRNGQVGTVYLNFNQKTGKFVDLINDDSSNYI